MGDLTGGRLSAWGSHQSTTHSSLPVHALATSFLSFTFALLAPQCSLVGPLTPMEGLAGAG